MTPRARRMGVGITGASGAPLAERVVRGLLDAGCEVHLTCSSAGREVISEELSGARIGEEIIPGFVHERLHEWHERDFRSPLASGSARIEAVVIVPCSLGTAGAIAQGVSGNLVRRAADVMLKERRKLILVPRETPLSSIQLDNLARVARAGAVVLPPVLTFYQRPGTGVDAQLDFIASRILDQLGIDNELYTRWGDR